MIGNGMGNNDQQNFQAWYVNILDSLYENRAAGIAVLMVSTPLLERYLRQKNGRSPAQELDDGCMTTLYQIFPALVDVATARKFWNVYRNGFLHQATLNLETRGGYALPSAALTHDIPDAIRVHSDGSFTLNPRRFSEQIVSTIKGNFATFVGTGTAAPPMTHVVAYVPASSPGLIVPPITLSTESRR